MSRDTTCVKAILSLCMASDSFGLTDNLTCKFAMNATPMLFPDFQTKHLALASRIKMAPLYLG